MRNRAAGPAQFNDRTGGVSRSPAPASSACGEPFGGGPGRVGGAAQETGKELEILVFVPGADLVHRGVHAGVDQVEAQDLCSSAAGRLHDDAAAVGGVAAAFDPAAAFEAVEDAGQGGGVEPGAAGQGARAERGVPGGEIKALQVGGLEVEAGGGAGGGGRTLW